MSPCSVSRRYFGLALAAGLLAAPRASADDLVDELPLHTGDWAWHKLARQGQLFEHWTPEEDDTWRWYRLERFVDPEWQTVGITLPMNKLTGQAFEPAEGYLNPERVPSHVRRGSLPEMPPDPQRSVAAANFQLSVASEREPDPEVHSRDGRPASQWLRELHARQLRQWLATVDPPPASVSGMTFWVHLVRDHGFDPRRIDGLTEDEFFRLHSAAHYGL